MNSSIIRFVLGYVLKMEAVLMLLPCIVAVLYREQTGFAYLLVAAVSMACILMTDKETQKSCVLFKRGLCSNGFKLDIFKFFWCTAILDFWRNSIFDRCFI